MTMKNDGMTMKNAGTPMRKKSSVLQNNEGEISFKAQICA